MNIKAEDNSGNSGTTESAEKAEKAEKAEAKAAGQDKSSTEDEKPKSDSASEDASEDSAADDVDIGEAFDGSLSLRESVNVIADDMLKKGTKCAKCDFEVCPVVSLYALSIKKAIDSCSDSDDGDDEDDSPQSVEEAKLASFANALTKIRSTAAAHSTEKSILGYIYRIAQEALSYDYLRRNKE